MDNPYVKGNNNIDNAQLFCFRYTNTANTRLLILASSRWQKPVVEQTYDDSKILLAASKRNYKNNNTTVEFQYSVAQVKELVDPRLQEYIIEQSPGQ